MSKLYQKYTSLKSQNQEKLYLFKSGIFYLFLDEDAKKMSPILSLKLTNLNEKILKCGFPVSKLDKYLALFKMMPYEVEIIDSLEIAPTNLTNYTINQDVKDLVLLICSEDLDTMSVKEAFELLSDLKTQATQIKERWKQNGNISE